MPLRRVLVADDYGDAAESLAELLVLDGYDTRVAYDGGQAIEIAAAFQPEILLLDLAMPKKDGFAVARFVRQTDWGKNALLIGVSGWSQSHVGQRCDHAGFDALLVKPVNHGEVVRLLADNKK